MAAPVDADASVTPRRGLTGARGTFRAGQAVAYGTRTAGGVAAGEGGGGHARRDAGLTRRRPRRERSAGRGTILPPGGSGTRGGHV